MAPPTATDMVGSLTLIREFDGKSSGISITEFLNQIQEVGCLNAWDDERKIQIARLKLTGAPRSFRDNDEEMRAITDWKLFCKFMRTRFTPQVSQTTRFFKYLNASQKENETMIDFSTRLSILHDKAKPPPTTTTAAATAERNAAKFEELLPILLNGLLDKKLSRRVLDRNPTDYKDALKIATQLLANSKTFVDSESNHVSINAMGGNAGVKKGPKIDFKKLQYTAEGQDAESRPVTPTNSAPPQAAAFAPQYDPQHFAPAPNFSQPRPHGPQQGHRGGYNQTWRAPAPRFSQPIFQGSGQNSGAYAQQTSGPSFGVAQQGAYAPNQQWARPPSRFTHCYYCGDPSHYANKCGQRKADRDRLRNLN
jgi:hypothetical protein